jgi:hypothetical protein
VSSPQRPIPPLEVRERAECMCAAGSTCSSFAPGHAVHLIQARLAAATPTEWLDALVVSADAHTGDVLVRTLESDALVALWSGAGAAEVLEVGSPVALHARYHVLADGARRFNVRVDS